MATSYEIKLSPDHSPGHTHVSNLKQESTDKTSSLLMLNHERYHTMFNDVGLHNHIVHHLLSLWALGASPSEIQAAYDLNTPFQKPLKEPTPQASLKMRDPAFFSACLGKNKHYADYLQFFQDEIAAKGVEEVVKEFMFKGDERADDIMARMYSGFEHPILHLGFGLEFKQPCLVAEALASACIHDNSPLPILRAIETHISTHPETEPTSLLAIATSLRSDPKISTAVHPSDPPDRLNYGLLTRITPADLAPHLSRWHVQPTASDLEFRCAEMAHSCIYISACAQKPGKKPSFDFFLMHSANLSVFYPVLMRLSWLSTAQRARLLSWKGWMDMLLFAACGCPALYPDRIVSYQAKSPGDWDGVIARARRYPDDGHTSKLLRAIMGARKVTVEYLTGGWSRLGDEFPLTEADFLTVAHMLMDSVEVMLEPGYRIPERIEQLYVKMLGTDEEVAKIVARFVRWCGVEGAWDDFPDLESNGSGTVKNGKNGKTSRL